MIEHNHIFKICKIDGLVRVHFKGSLLYVSPVEDLIDRMRKCPVDVSFDLFLFSEILEYNDSISNNSFDFSKEFLYFAKECRDDRQESFGARKSFSKYD